MTGMQAYVQPMGARPPVMAAVPPVNFVGGGKPGKPGLQPGLQQPMVSPSPMPPLGQMSASYERR